MNRAEHLNWCKQRALEYLNPGQFFSIDDAMASMASDLGKHDETRHDHQNDYWADVSVAHKRPIEYSAADAKLHQWF